MTEHSRQTIRELYIAKRNALSESEQSKAAQALLLHATSQDLFLNTKRVALYKTFGGEINTQLLIEHLWHKDIEVYLPVLHPFCKGHLLFLRYTQTSEMKKNCYGIEEPVLDVRAVCPPNQLDIVFTPLVAFDDAGNRLGMGGGYYDRTLIQFKASSSISKPLVIGLAHDCQHCKKLPIEPWDVPLSAILSPSHFYQ